MTAVDEARTLYRENLQALSTASVNLHFDAFLDIPWDEPEYAVIPDDPRWVLPDADPLGHTDWYKSQPLDRQIHIGMYRQASMVKVGLQFEQILISGLMHYALTLPNDSPEFRYSTHEATEECHHTQMFQELVNRIGIDVPGGPGWFRKVVPALAVFASKAAPFGFFVGVLAGEEPIDHMQKGVLRSGAQGHPLVMRVMQIHIAEEARHIGFAHQYLQYKAPRLGRIQKAAISVLMPVVMRLLCDVIMKPGKQMRRDLAIPDAVVADVWWNSDPSRKALRDTFGDVRMLATDLGLMNRVSRKVWQALGIAGRPSRYRSEPSFG